MRRAAILTAIQDEYKAVRAYLTEPHEEHHPQGNVYECGSFLGRKQDWEVVIGQIGAGNAGAAFEAERAISYFQPAVILFVGVAGGIKDVKLGDVVAATEIYGYESGKAETKFLPRADIGHSTYRLVERAKAEAKKENWLQRLQEPLPLPSLPHVYVAPIAAGEKVVASTRSQIAKFLKMQYGKALAVEMEGYGFLQAVHANPSVEALVIRGISDLIDNKAEVDAKSWQGRAAHHASAFAFEVLDQLDLPVHRSSSLDEPKVQSQPVTLKPSSTFPANLDHQQLEQLHQALVLAFPTPAELERFVYYKLSANIETFTSGDLSNRVYGLLTWVQSNGRVEELITAALKVKGRNPALVQFATAIGFLRPGPDYF